MATDYYTRKVNVTAPLGDEFSATDSLSNYYVTHDAFHNHIVYEVDTNDAFGIEFVHNPEGYIRYNNMNEHYHFYYIKDHLGNVRETYKIPNAGTKECVQRMQYYPSGVTDRTDPVTGRFDPAGTWGDIAFARWIYNNTHNKNTTFLIYTRIVGYKPYSHKF